VHPCAYFSHKLSPAEENYDIGNRELLAVKLALEEWRHWLEGAEQPFLVWTDHKNLEYIRTAKRLNSRQARWALFFSRFHFTLSYWPGSHNTKPDALSRLSCRESSFAEPVNILPEGCVIGVVTWEIEEEVRASHHQTPPPSTCPVNRLFVPENLRSRVLHWVHASRFSCHPGERRTLAALEQRFWWPSMKADTAEFVHACPVCAHNKPSTHAPAGLLHPLTIPRYPWSHIALHFVTGLPLSQGNTTILTVIDRF
ncbi:hypothetical protein LDENG_00016960, partial [Lucifuga dentata]